MTPLLLAVTGVLFAVAIGLQILYSAPSRAGQQAALQLPSALLYSVSISLLVFSLFPDSYATARALGFSVGGAGAFVIGCTWVAFNWLSKASKRDEVERELAEVRKENAALRQQMGVVKAAGKPRRLQRTTRATATIRSDRRHRLGIITGNIANVVGVDVWVNAENTRMEMARPTEPTISGTIRYRGGTRNQAGDLSDDIIQRELTAVAGRTPVIPGTVFVTGPGELRVAHGVKRILHVASVEGSPGSGFRQVPNVDECVRNVLAEMDRLGAGGEELRTVVMPLLGTGNGGGDPHHTATTMVDSAIDYFRAHPSSQVRTVYLLAFTNHEEMICRLVLESHPDVPSLSKPT